MPFTAGQRLLASELNTGTPQLLGSSILTSSQPSVTIAVSGSANGIGINGLQVTWKARSDTAAAAINFVLQFNGDTGANYAWQKTEGNNAGTSSSNSGGLATSIQVGTIPAATATANYFGTGHTIVSCPASITAFKSCAGHATSMTTSSTGFTGTYGGLWQSTAAITSVTLKALSGNMVADSMVAVYGL